MINIKDIHIEFNRVLFDNEQMSIPYGKVTGLVGSSGSGKTTLLQEIGLLGKCQFMEYEFDGQIVNHFNSHKKSSLQRNDISFIFQDTLIFQELTLIENIEMHAEIAGQKVSKNEIFELLHFVNLNLDLDTDVLSMSGGEVQRLAIVCGLIKDAKLFLFDEPTAYLDRENKKLIIDIIKRLTYEKNKMVLIATHDEELKENFDIIYMIDDRHLKLTKNSSFENHKVVVEDRPFNFGVLMRYVFIIRKKHRMIRRIVCLTLSMIISLVVLLNTYSQNYQQANGKSLLNLMNHEVLIIKEEAKKISAKEQAQIKNQLLNYTVYSDYEYIGQNDMSEKITIRGYLEEEVTNFKIYEDFKTHNLLNNSDINKQIYISYSLYQSSSFKPQIKFSDMNWNSLLIQPTKVLKPSVNLEKTIYLPYNIFEDYLKSIGIDIELEQVSQLRVSIQSTEEIKEIEKFLPKGFIINQSKDMKINVIISEFFNSNYLMIIICLAFICTFIYKVYDMLKIKKDVALLKTLGVNTLQIIKAKGLDEFINGLLMFIGSLTITILSLMLLDVFSINTFLSSCFWLMVISLAIYISLIFVYILFVMNFSPAMLLKIND